MTAGEGVIAVEIAYLAARHITFSAPIPVISPAILAELRGRGPATGIISPAGSRSEPMVSPEMNTARER